MNKNQQLPTTLPKEFHKFFWDIDATKLDPSQHALYVVNRLLDKGDLEAARWVLKEFPKDIILETFKKRRDFSPWNGVFWSRYLQIPREEMACLEPSYRKLRTQLWPY